MNLPAMNDELGNWDTFRMKVIIQVIVIAQSLRHCEFEKLHHVDSDGIKTHHHPVKNADNQIDRHHE